MSKKITKNELREILRDKPSKVSLDIYKSIFETKMEQINDLIGNHSERKITLGLQRYGWDFEVI